MWKNTNLLSRKIHCQFKRVREFFEAEKTLFSRIFISFTDRYKAAQEIPELLLPIRRGPESKFEEIPPPL